MNYNQINYNIEKNNEIEKNNNINDNTNNVNNINNKILKTFIHISEDSNNSEKKRYKL